MNNIALTLILSLAAALIVNICRKYFSAKHATGVLGSFAFNGVCSLTAALVLLCWGGFATPSAFTVWLGVLFGSVTALQGISYLSALQCGPMSYTSVINSFSTLISALSGVAFFGEHLGWAQIVGMILMLGSFVLAVKGDTQSKKANFKWFLLCLATFFGTGGIGVMQKVHQSSAYRQELNEFLIIAFVMSAFLCALLIAVLKKRAHGLTDKTKPTAKRPWFMVGIMLVSGVRVAANNKFNLYLSGVMDSAVFFPIVNGGGLVLITLAALVLFRETLTKRQWVGVALGIASVVFLCNPFG
ncbi:MAG: hypothetical protein IJF33_03040 [Clostridia bacterium]|nr:hypothetical protein [Clostridia bacterium]